MLTASYAGLRVMQWNTLAHGLGFDEFLKQHPDRESILDLGNRLRQTARVIADNHPHIVVLEEVNYFKELFDLLKTSEYGKYTEGVWAPKNPSPTEAAGLPPDGTAIIWRTDNGLEALEAPVAIRIPDSSRTMMLGSFAFNGTPFRVIGLHLKAGANATSDAIRARELEYIVGILRIPSVDPVDGPFALAQSTRVSGTMAAKALEIGETVTVGIGEAANAAVSGASRAVDSIADGFKGIWGAFNKPSTADAPDDPKDLADSAAAPVSSAAATAGDAATAAATAAADAADAAAPSDPAVTAARMVDKLPGSPCDALLLLGDFNAEPDGPLVEGLRGMGFMPTIDPPPSWTTAKVRATAVQRCIDYILYRDAVTADALVPSETPPVPTPPSRADACAGKWAIARGYTAGVPLDTHLLPSALMPSDHIPVVALLRWRKELPPAAPQGGSADAAAGDAVGDAVLSTPLTEPAPVAQPVREDI